MKMSQSLVAQQYAKAYILEYGTSLSMQDVYNFKQAILFCKTHRDFLPLISLLTAQQKGHHELMDELVEHFDLPKNIINLVDVVTMHKRIPFFAAILQNICCLFYQQMNLLEVTISSAVELDEKQIKKFELFFEKLSHKKIISSVVVDQSLIAGVRMQSNMFLWQYSIRSRTAELLQYVGSLDKIS